MLNARANELMKPIPINYLQHLVNLPGDALVRLYSYQSREAWLDAVARGYWTGNPDVVEDKDDRGFQQAYQWMQEQMQERVPDYSGDLPLWAWLKRPSTKPKEKRYMGTTGDVRLTVLVPRSRILFSDYDTWHSVLNQGSIHRTEALHDEHSDLHWETDEDHYQTDQSIAASRLTWPACLSFEEAKSQDEMAWGVPKKYFRAQACIDRIYWQDIQHVRVFTPKDLVID